MKWKQNLNSSHQDAFEYFDWTLNLTPGAWPQLPMGTFPGHRNLSWLAIVPDWWRWTYLTWSATPRANPMHSQNSTVRWMGLWRDLSFFSHTEGHFEALPHEIRVYSQFLDQSHVYISFSTFFLEWPYKPSSSQTFLGSHSYPYHWLPVDMLIRYVWIQTFALSSTSILKNWAFPKTRLLCSVKAMSYCTS